MGEPLPDFGGLTPQQLVDTWELIATLGEVPAERLLDPLAEPIRNIADLEEWAPLVSRVGLEEAARAALNLRDRSCLFRRGGGVRFEAQRIAWISESTRNPPTQRSEPTNMSHPELWK
ncbi:MAG TPA: hypothetical protein VGR37_06740 [Longimicrobiaceae bacterium]|nr:hypothetical protein [Longimicrobiaceae bacterium]